MSFLRVTIIFVVLYMAWRAYLDIRSGVLRIGEDHPIIMISRRHRPMAFWLFVAFFYTILSIMLSAVIFWA